MQAARILFRRILSQRWSAVVIVVSLAVGIGVKCLGLVNWRVIEGGQSDPDPA
jgi:hypothetical protein